jgi:hypothetical protein
VGINDLATCNEEIESLKREIGDRASERWTDARTPTRRGPGCGGLHPSATGFLAAARVELPQPVLGSQ